MSAPVRPEPPRAQPGQFLEHIGYLQGLQKQLRAAGEAPYSEDELRAYFAQHVPGVEVPAAVFEAINRPQATPTQRALRTLNQVFAGGLDELLGVMGGSTGRGAVAADAIRAAEAAPAEPGERLMTGLVAGVPAAMLGARLPVPESLLGRLTAQLGTGAAAGAATGALSAESGARKDAAVMGGLVGGAAALPIAAVELTNAMRPSVMAAKDVQQAVRGDFGTPEAAVDFARAEAERQRPRLLGDLGPRLRSETDFAANQTADVRVPLAQQLERRQRGQAERLEWNTRQAVEFPVEVPEIYGARLAEAKAAWADSPQGFGGLREANPRLGVAELADLMRTSTVRGAWQKALTAGDITLEDVPTHLVKVFRLSGDLKSAAPGRPVSFRDVHNFRQVLQRKADQAFKARDGELGRAYATVRDAVDDAIEKQVPAYGAVRAEYARRSAEERAFQIGAEVWQGDPASGLARFLTQERRRGDLAGATSMESLFGKLTKGEQAEVRKGIAMTIAADLRDAGRSTNVARRLADRSAQDQRLIRAVFGDDKRFVRFLSDVEEEVNMQRLGQAVGGSQTAGRQAEAAQRGGPVDVLAATATAPPYAVPSILAAKNMGWYFPAQRAKAAGTALRAEGADAITEALARVQRLAAPYFGMRLPALAGSAAAAEAKP